MRLKTPAEVMNDAGSSAATERKRSRPTSSLDIKVPDGAKLTSTRIQRPTRPPTQEQQQQQQQQQQRQRLIGSKPTLAQKGGFPPKSYDFISDLDDLTEVQLRAALEQDPELSAAAEAAEKEKKQRRSSYYRNRDGKVGSLDEHPQHLRAMMEEGIPIKQWIILLVLLGAGLYQLRKVLGPPVEKSGKKNAAVKKTPAQKTPKKAGKLKKKTSALAKNKASRSAPTETVEQKLVIGKKQMTKKDENALPDSEASRSVPKLVPDEKDAFATATAKKELVAPDVDEDKAVAAQSLNAKKPKSAKKKKKPAKKAVPKESSSVDNGRPHGVTSTNGSAGADTGGVEHLNSAGEGVGWQTVGKGSATDVAKDTNDSEGSLATKRAENDQQQQAATEATTETVVAAPMASKETSSTSAAQKGASSSSAVETAPKRNGKGKNSLPTKPIKANATPNAPEATFTDDDAALALKLQEEEEMLAKDFSQPAGEDTWAEVAPKRSRRKTAESAAGPAATEEW